MYLRVSQGWPGEGANQKTPVQREMDGVNLDRLAPGAIRDVSSSIAAWLIAEGYADAKCEHPIRTPTEPTIAAASVVVATSGRPRLNHASPWARSDAPAAPHSRPAYPRRRTRRHLRRRRRRRGDACARTTTFAPCDGSSARSRSKSVAIDQHRMAVPRAVHRPHDRRVRQPDTDRRSRARWTRRRAARSTSVTSAAATRGRIDGAQAGEERRQLARFVVLVDDDACVRPRRCARRRRSPPRPARPPRRCRRSPRRGTWR